MCQKPKYPLQWPIAAPQVCCTPPHPSCSLFILWPYIKYKYGRLGAPFLRYLWFREGTKILNGPRDTNNWHISNLTKKGPRCHKVSWVQIWQKNSNGKCSKLPKRSCQSVWYKVVKEVTTISCHKMVFAALWWHFPPFSIFYHYLIDKKLRKSSGKCWSVTCTFFNTIFIHIQGQITVKSSRKMALLFDGQTGDLY